MNMKGIYLTLSIILIGFVVFMSIRNSSTADSTPSAIVKKYYELALEGKIDEALSLWKNCKPDPTGTCAGGEIVSGEDPIVRWTKGIYKDKSTFTIEEEKIEGEQASVLVSYKINDWKMKTLYKMIKTEGKWMLHELSSPALEEADKNAEKFRRE